MTTVLHWLVGFIVRGRAQRVATQQQVYGRLALEQMGPRVEALHIGVRPTAVVCAASAPADTG